MAVFVQCDDCGGVVQLTNWAFPSYWTGASNMGDRFGRVRCKDCKDAGDHGYDAAVEERRKSRRPQIEIG